MIAPSRHSQIVGGSTAARVLACPGSVSLCQQVPKPPSTRFADEGSMLHAAAASVVLNNWEPKQMLGFGTATFGVTLDDTLLEKKLAPAIRALDDYLNEIETLFNATADVQVEKEVDFGKYLPDVFGSCDVIIRTGPLVTVLDWKFGFHEVPVEENAQLLFYAAAAMKTPALKKMFDGAEQVELVVIQPLSETPLKRWSTTIDRVERFAVELKTAVKMALSTAPDFRQGEHCVWCHGKPLCPLMTGAAAKALTIDLKAVDVSKVGRALEEASLLEGWIKDLRALAQQALEHGVEIPGWKLVPKRPTRQWVNEENVIKAFIDAKLVDNETDAASLLTETKLKSPAQAEKLFKQLPEGLVVAISSGTTMVKESDKRPSVMTTVALATALKSISNI